MIKKTFDELKLTGNLPSPPGVGMRILKLTQGEDFSAEEIGQAIMADPALTGRLLKIANSAAAGGASAVTTVSEATMRLGVRAVRNVALGLSLVSNYRQGACSAFQYDRYWSMSLARAVAAQAISRATRIGTPAEAYVLGLLADIGSLALACVHPEDYARLLGAAGTQRMALRRAERQSFEIDHAEVGAYMLEEWGLPSTFTEAVLAYEEPRNAKDGAGRRAGLTQVLALASGLAEACLTTESSENVDWAGLARALEELRERLGLHEAQFNEFCNGVIREWIEWGATLKVPAQRGIELARIGEFAARAGSASAPSHLVAPSVPVAPQAPAATPAAQGLRVLAVDDDPTSLKLLEHLLVRSGHVVSVARDGTAALQLALEANPQVVIADWLMPGMDGLELCRALRRIEAGRDIFFLLLTGRVEEDRVVEAFDAGVDDFVTKPFNPRILLARLKGGQRVIELKQQVESERSTVRNQVAELGQLTRKLRTAAMTDVLTELPNRRYALKKLEQEWDSSVRNDRPLSVIMVDVDHFKQVNDTHGHGIGDLVLRETAGVLRDHSRLGEEPTRLGGEEFLVICPNTNLQQARACAERLRVAVAAHEMRGGAYAGRITVSLGVAARGPEAKSIDALIKGADEAVYAAKSAGRNQVSCLGESVSAPQARSA